MADYRNILVAGNQVLTDSNFEPKNFPYLVGEPGAKGDTGNKGTKGFSRWRW